jgi:hypothetical protein
LDKNGLYPIKKEDQEGQIKRSLGILYNFYGMTQHKNLLNRQWQDFNDLRPSSPAFTLVKDRQNGL